MEEILKAQLTETFQEDKMSPYKIAIIYLVVFIAVCPNAEGLSPHGFLGVGQALRILWARGGLVATVGSFLYDLFKTANTQEQTSQRDMDYGANLEAGEDDGDHQIEDYEMDYEMDYEIQKW